MDNLLLKISLIISVLGILILLIISNSEPLISKISALNKTSANILVKIKGKLISIREAGPNFFILNIQDSSGKIEVTSGKKFPVNSTLEILGKTDIYQNKTQISAEKIIKI